MPTDSHPFSGWTIKWTDFLLRKCLGSNHHILCIVRWTTCSYLRDYSHTTYWSSGISNFLPLELPLEAVYCLVHAQKMLIFSMKQNVLLFPGLCPGLSSGWFLPVCILKVIAGGRCLEMSWANPNAHLCKQLTSSSFIRLATCFTRVFCCYCLGQSRIVAPCMALYSHHKSSPCRLPILIHLVNEKKRISLHI